MSFIYFTSSSSSSGCSCSCSFSIGICNCSIGVCSNINELIPLPFTMAISYHNGIYIINIIYDKSIGILLFYL